LSAGPVDVPLELRIPSIGVSAPVVGVGITAQNVMDAPKGPIGDPAWQTAFWYRGSGIPGESGTAAIAGHVDDPLGRPAIFARIQELLPGDLIVVHDTRSGLDIRFMVTQNTTYSVQQTADPSVLAEIYGDGPAFGRGPQPAADGLSHLSLITCTGYIVNGSFDHHVVVYATRTE
jgi:sortase (surface protein transpeptidase)